MLKFEIYRDELVEGLQKVQRGVAKKTTMPILEGIKFETKDHQLILTSSNLDISVESVIQTKVTESGSIVLPSDFLYSLVKKWDGDNIIFEEKTEGIVTMACGRSTCKIKGMSAKEFPVFPKPKEAYNFEIPSDTLRGMIKQTVYAVAVNESFPVLTGEKWEVDNNALTVVGLDGYRMAIHIGKLSKPIAEPLSITVPGKALKELERMLPDKGNIAVQVSGSQIFFQIDSQTIFTSRLLEGEYIDYKKVIPQDKKTVVKVNRSDMLNSAERSALLANDHNHNTVIFSIQDEELVVKANSQLGDSEEILPIQKWGDDLQIAFNAKFLIEALQSCTDDFVKIRMINPLSPALITSEDTSLVTMILPIKVNTETAETA